MFGLGSLTTKLIIAGVAAAALAGLWFHYQGLHDEIAALEVSNAQLSTALDLKAQEVASLQAQADSSRRRAEVAGQTVRAAQARVDALEGLLERHDLAMLVKRKPGLVTRRMRSGTAAVHKEIEDAANEVLQ